MNKLLILIISILSFSASNFAEEIESANVPTNIRKTFNKFLPDASPDNCKWFLENEGKEYQAQCPLIENDQESPTINFTIGKKGDKPSMSYFLAQELMTKYNVPEKALKKAKEAFAKFKEADFIPEVTGAEVSIGNNGKVKSYLLTGNSYTGGTLKANFNGSGNMVGKVIHEEMHGH